MKKTIICCLVFSFALSSDLLAGDSGFVNTSDAILESLTTGEVVMPTRSFSVVEPSKRAIIVRVKDNGKEQNKEVLVQENSPVGVARLKVEFDVNSSRLRSQSYQILDQLGIALGDIRLADAKVCIKGHTDSDGNESYNLGLSYDRAEAVREYVIARHELSVSRLFVIGYGEQVPLAANDNARHKQMNRRVEVTLGCPEVY